MAVKLSHGKALSMLSLTSLIDVVFLLLIFFLVATKFAEEDNLKHLQTQLPSASEAKPLTSKPDALKITVSASSEYFVDGKPMSLTELDRFLERSAANNPLTQTANVFGDKRASWEDIVHALNACQKHGITPKPMMDNKAVLQ
jgi:biopolymer transport protein ExbD